LQEITSPNLKVVSGQTLPEGWLGKNFACHQLAAQADGSYLVFVDADVRLAPRAITACERAFVVALQKHLTLPIAECIPLRGSS